MTEQTTTMGFVGETIKELLPAVNNGFDWDFIKDHYDEEPVGTAMSLHFTDEEGEETAEELYLGIAEGPQIIVLDQLTADWDYLGAIVTRQESGARILDPKDPMTPDRARYTHRDVAIQPSEAESRERVWMVVSNVLEAMLESLIYQNDEDSGSEVGA